MNSLSVFQPFQKLQWQKKIRILEQRNFKWILRAFSNLFKNSNDWKNFYFGIEEFKMDSTSVFQPFQNYNDRKNSYFGIKEF